MRERPYCTAILLAAGKGKRMGTTVSKQFLPICGKEILAWTVDVFENSPSVDEIFLVAHAWMVWMTSSRCKMPIYGKK